MKQQRIAPSFLAMERIKVWLEKYWELSSYRLATQFNLINPIDFHYFSQSDAKLDAKFR
jgi:hypothetical protein